MSFLMKEFLKETDSNCGDLELTERLDGRGLLKKIVFSFSTCKKSRFKIYDIINYLQYKDIGDWFLRNYNYDITPGCCLSNNFVIEIVVTNLDKNIFDIVKDIEETLIKEFKKRKVNYERNQFNQFNSL